MEAKIGGNFISVNGLNTGRFLDPPEFEVLHDKGNEENVFDRFDYQPTTEDSIHLEPELHPLLVSDSERLHNLERMDLFGGGQTEPALWESFGRYRPALASSDLNIAPTWTRISVRTAVFNSGRALFGVTVQLLP